MPKDARKQPIGRHNSDATTPASLPERMTQPLLWGYGLGAVTMIVQLGGTAVMARLLEPALFGQVAAAAAVLRFLQYVSDLGLTSAVIREWPNSRDCARPLRTAMISANLVLAGLIWLSAPLLLSFAAEPTETAVAILRVLALGPVLAAFGQISSAFMQSRLDLQGIGLAGLAAQIAGSVLVAIPMAFAGFGIWSLIAGSLVQTATLAVIFLLRAPLPQAAAPTKRSKALHRLGLKYMLLRLLDAAGQAVVPLALSILVGMTAVGLYDRSFVLTIVVLDWLSTGIGRVIQPMLVETHRATNDPEYGASVSPHRPAMVLTDALTIGGGILLAVALGILICRELLASVILGADWLAAAPVIGLLAAWAWLRGLAIICGTSVEAIGSLSLRAFHQGSYLAIMVTALAIIQPQSVTAVLTVVLWVEAINITAFLIFGAHSAGLSLAQLLRTLLGLPMPGLLVAAGLLALLWRLPDVSRALALGLAIPSAAILLGLGLYWHPFPTARQRIRLYASEIFRLIGHGAKSAAN